MARRVLDFADGFTSASAPTTGTLWAASNTVGAPLALDGATGVTLGGYAYELIFVVGDGAAQSMLVDPQVDPGTNVGQMVRLVGTNSVNTITFIDGSGLFMNGDVVLSDHSSIDLMWDGSLWIEVARNDI